MTLEIGENLCRAELTASQRTGYTKRRKQIWEALHPENNSGSACATIRETAGRPKEFAASTAESTGRSKATTNRAIARADALGDEALAKVANTSLDSGVELDALAKMDAPERAELAPYPPNGGYTFRRSKRRICPTLTRPVGNQGNDDENYYSFDSYLCTICWRRCPHHTKPTCEQAAQNKHHNKKTMTKTISTFEEALAYLSEFAEGKEESAPAVNFSGELAKISAAVTGSRYHSSIPGELARGLWEYQEAIYKAVAFALYNVEDIRKLTTSQRCDFELVFEISEGSTDLVVKLKDFLTKLGEGFLTMDSKHKAYTLVAIAAILAAGVASSNIIESNSAIKKEEVKANLEIKREEEKTRQFEIFSRVAIGSPVASKFSKAVEDGSRAIVRSAYDADEIRIGRVKLNRSDIEEVNQRSIKERATAEILQEDFRVFGTNSKDAGATKYQLARPDGTEFSVTISHEDHTAADLDKIWSAARDRKPISLEVNATIIRGVIKTAQIIKVL